MSFDIIINGLAPIFLLIALGYGLKRLNFLPVAAWPPISSFAIYVLYPGWLIPAVWHADLTDFSTGPVGFGVLGAVAVATGVGFGLKPVLRLSGPTFTSVFQGLMRFNSFVFVPVAAAIFGPKANGIAGVAISALIPASNMVCILVLAQWGEPPENPETPGSRPDRSAWGLATTLLTNPIFASCLIGLALNIVHAPSAPLIDKPLAMLGQAAIPMGLILAGAGLSFSYIVRKPSLVTLVSLFKVLVMPLLAYGICRALGGDKLAQGVALACGAAPCAAAAYVQARHMGGDAPLMAGIVAMTTTISSISMPLLLWGLGLV